MIKREFLHCCGIVPTLHYSNEELAVIARGYGLPVTAVLVGNMLTLSGEGGEWNLPVIHNVDGLKEIDVSGIGLSAVGEELCREPEYLVSSYPDVKWLPVGRFQDSQMVAFMKERGICAVCDLTFEDHIDEWDKKCQEARRMALGYAFAHLGINNENDTKCGTVVRQFGEAFGFRSFDIGNSVIVDGSFEVMKARLYGKCGHIGIETSSVLRASADLQEKGFQIDEGTIQRSQDGDIVSVYLKKEFGGFAVHLLQKR